MNDNVLTPADRIDGLLQSEASVWLSTVAPDGRPHLVPIWFTWDGERLFVASKPGARKVRNLQHNARLMLALGEADEDFDVGLIEAEAELPDAPTRALIPAEHFRKYEAAMRALGLGPDEYCETYSQPIVIRPTRFLPWHGRTVPRSAVADAGGPAVVRRAVDRLLAPLGLRRALAPTGA